MHFYHLFVKTGVAANLSSCSIWCWFLFISHSPVSIQRNITRIIPGKVPFFAEPVPPLNDDPHFYQIFKHFRMHFITLLLLLISASLIKQAVLAQVPWLDLDQKNKKWTGPWASSWVASLATGAESTHWQHLLKFSYK